MKTFLTFLMFCVILAVLRAALITLLVALILALLFSFITRPRETLVLLGSLGLLGLAGARPATFIITLGLVAVAAVIDGARPRAQGPMILTDGREEQ